MNNAVVVLAGAALIVAAWAVARAEHRTATAERDAERYAYAADIWKAVGLLHFGAWVANPTPADVERMRDQLHRVHARTDYVPASPIALACIERRRPTQTANVVGLARENGVQL